jgi:hypothetical protein
LQLKKSYPDPPQANKTQISYLKYLAISHSCDKVSALASLISSARKSTEGIGNRLGFFVAIGFRAAAVMAG